MEHFEELVTACAHTVNHIHTGVEDLEKGAFERGLPQKGKVLIGSQNLESMKYTLQRKKISEQSEPYGAPPVILLIDDEVAFRSVLKQVLLNAGYDVVEASNGAEGIRYFYEKPADMIITDIIMPEKEGIETIIELKKAYPDVKLIAMSGGGWYGTEIDFDMAKKLGAHTLNKPFALQELLDVVCELMKEKDLL